MVVPKGTGRSESVSRGGESQGVTEYDRGFYAALHGPSRSSAERVVPLVLTLVEPRSVVDVGCGLGTWLSVFRERGVEDILGIDRDYVPRESLDIPADNFLALDLTKPFRIERRFDLAVCLEVAEHLPAACAEGFVRSLVGLAPIVLFSAAIPYQGGTRHLNEQWPEYWTAHFRSHGYVPIDALRRSIWNDREVQFYYRQNMIVFAEETAIADTPLEPEYRRTSPEQLSVVIPELYLQKAAYVASLSRLSGMVPGVVKNAARSMLAWLGRTER